MALYQFRCPAGHTTEAVVPMGTETLSCSCGEAAERLHVYHFDVVGPTVDTRGKYRRYQEAQSELAYAEEKTGEPAPRLWPQAKRRVRNLIRAGESPYPARKA